MKALGQENIDDLLKLSEDYKKSKPTFDLGAYILLPLTRTTGELEVTAARSEAGNLVEERREEIIHQVATAPPPTFLPPPPVAHPAPHPAPVFAAPPPQHVHAPTEVVEKTTIIRDVSPARSYTTTTSGTTSRTPVVVDVRREEFSEEIPVGPLALIKSERRRSRSRSEVRSDIRRLERSRHRHSDREVIKAERLSTGELILYEEQIEKIEEPRRGVRIEKDKKGRMSISVPKYR